MPWNLPLLSISWKAAPAMACGNVVVAKPSEETPATATLLAEVMQCSGVPDGVFNLVHGHGETGAAMTSHSGVNAISFTGETSTGEAIMRNAAAGVRPVSFELGGKNPAIVFADCDFDAAVAGVARSSFFNTGQVCLCTERVYVERAIFDRFVVALAGAARAMRIGDPLDRKTNMGPLISQGHRKRVLSYYDLALDEGATLVTGGCVPAGLDSGSFVEPTVWIGLGNDARCLQEEIFGPVCHVMPFDEEAEAITLANDSRFGLAASVWTGNVQRAVRVAGTVDVGLTWINGWFVRDLRTPFGGGKLSGIGREGGRHSFDFYSEIRNICIAL
jgi:aminomuconate-semialdehyde/2-hydroxymuconate-6-semialdehyde dehydrogenase